MRARKHAYILIQTRLDFLLQSASESVFRAERHLFSIACKHWANHQTLPCTYAKSFDTKNKQSNGSLSSKRTAGLVQDFLFYTNMNDIFICTITLSQTQETVKSNQTSKSKPLIWFCGSINPISSGSGTILICCLPILVYFNNTISLFLVLIITSAICAAVRFCFLWRVINGLKSGRFLIVMTVVMVFGLKLIYLQSWDDSGLVILVSVQKRWRLPRNLAEEWCILRLLWGANGYVLGRSLSATGRTKGWRITKTHTDKSFA